MSEELLLIPGPTMLSPRVLGTLGMPQLGHGDPRFVEAFKETLELVKYLFVAPNSYPYILAGSGTLAMESVVVSLIEEGDRVLVLDTGHFGERFAEMLRIHGAIVDLIEPEFGRHADPGDVDEALSKGGHRAVFVTHVDTSSTVANPVREIAGVAREHGAMCVVDSVCGVGGMELRFEDWGIDVALTGSQKAIAAPPGLAIVVLSEGAMEAIEGRRRPIRSYYMDLTRWRRVMEDPSIYLATPAVNLIIAMRQALLELKEEGLEKRWARHRRIADLIRRGIDALGLRFVAEDGYRADTVTGIYIPDGKAKRLVKELRSYGMIVTLGLYEHRDEMIRVGHFGNITPNHALSLVAALEAGCRRLGVAEGRALESASKLYEGMGEA